MEYKPLWHYRVVDFGEPLGSLAGVTQHMRVRAGISGTGLRVKLDNRFNRGQMVISGVTAAIAEREDSAVRLTVRDSSSVTLAPGESVLTDHAALAVSAGQSVELSISFALAEGVAGLCQTSSPRVWRSHFTQADSREPQPDGGGLLRFLTGESWAALGVSQIDLLTEARVLTIGMFGDSITHMSYYTDALFERLLREYPGRAVLANCGISGNRLCYDPVSVPGDPAFGRHFGPAGKKRFEGDLYTGMKPELVLSLLGTNDCNHGPAYGDPAELPTVEDFAAAYTGVIETAHRHGSRIYIGTIPPFNTPDWAAFHDRAEARRLELNAWIASQTLADGVIDFAAVAEDPEKKGVLREGFDLGDRLHPGVTGGEMMASIVPLDEFFASGRVK